MADALRELGGRGTTEEIGRQTASSNRREANGDGEGQRGVGAGAAGGGEARLEWTSALAREPVIGVGIAKAMPPAGTVSRRAVQIWHNLDWGTVKRLGLVAALDERSLLPLRQSAPMGWCS